MSRLTRSRLHCGCGAASIVDVAQILWPDVCRLRPDQSTVAQLLQAMRRPADAAADGEGRREESGRQIEAVQQQRGVELDVRVEMPVGLALAQQAQRRSLDAARQIVQTTVAGAGVELLGGG